jgi:hypothetical protein
MAKIGQGTIKNLPTLEKNIPKIKEHADKEKEVIATGTARQDTKRVFRSFEAAISNLSGPALRLNEGMKELQRLIYIELVDAGDAGDIDKFKELLDNISQRSVILLDRLSRLNKAVADNDAAELDKVKKEIESDPKGENGVTSTPDAGGTAAGTVDTSTVSTPEKKKKGDTVTFEGQSFVVGEKYTLSQKSDPSKSMDIYILDGSVDGDVKFNFGLNDPKISILSLALLRNSDVVLSSEVVAAATGTGDKQEKLEKKEITLDGGIVVKVDEEYSLVKGNSEKFVRVKDITMDENGEDLFVVSPKDMDEITFVYTKEEFLEGLDAAANKLMGQGASEVPATHEGGRDRGVVFHKDYIELPGKDGEDAIKIKKGDTVLYTNTANTVIEYKLHAVEKNLKVIFVIDPSGHKSQINLEQMKVGNLRKGDAGTDYDAETQRLIEKRKLIEDIRNLKVGDTIISNSGTKRKVTLMDGAKIEVFTTKINGDTFTQEFDINDFAHHKSWIKEIKKQDQAPQPEVIIESEIIEGQSYDALLGEDKVTVKIEKILDDGKVRISYMSDGVKTTGTIKESDLLHAISKAKQMEQAPQQEVIIEPEIVEGQSYDILLGEDKVTVKIEKILENGNVRISSMLNGVKKIGVIEESNLLRVILKAKQMEQAPQAPAQERTAIPAVATEQAEAVRERSSEAEMSSQEMFEMIGPEKLRGLFNDFLNPENTPEQMYEKFKVLFSGKENLPAGFKEKWEAGVYKIVCDAVRGIVEYAKAREIQRHPEIKAHEEKTKGGGFWTRIKRGLPHGLMSGGLAASAAVGVGVLTGGAGLAAVAAAGAAGTWARRVLKRDKAKTDQKEYADVLKGVESDLKLSGFPVGMQLNIGLEQMMSAVQLAMKESESTSQLSQDERVKALRDDVLERLVQNSGDALREGATPEALEKHANYRLASSSRKIDAKNRERLLANNTYEATKRLEQNSSFFGALGKYISSGAQSELWLHDKSKLKRYLGDAISMTFGGAVGATIAVTAPVGLVAYGPWGEFLARTGLRAGVGASTKGMESFLNAGAELEQQKTAKLERLQGLVDSFGSIGEMTQEKMNALYREVEKTDEFVAQKSPEFMARLAKAMKDGAGRGAFTGVLGALFEGGKWGVEGGFKDMYGRLADWFDVDFPTVPTTSVAGGGPTGPTTSIASRTTTVPGGATVPTTPGSPAVPHGGSSTGIPRGGAAKNALNMNKPSVTGWNTPPPGGYKSPTSFIAESYNIKKGEGLLHAANDFQRGSYRTQMLNSLKTAHPEWDGLTDNQIFHKWRVEEVEKFGVRIPKDGGGWENTKTLRPDAEIELVFDKDGPHMQVSDASQKAGLVSAPHAPRVYGGGSKPNRGLLDFGTDRSYDDAVTDGQGRVLDGMTGKPMLDENDNEIFARGSAPLERGADDLQQLPNADVKRELKYPQGAIIPPGEGQTSGVVAGGEVVAAPQAPELSAAEQAVQRAQQDKINIILTDGAFKEENRRFVWDQYPHVNNDDFKEFVKDYIGPRRDFDGTDKDQLGHLMASWKEQAADIERLALQQESAALPPQASPVLERPAAPEIEPPSAVEIPAPGAGIEASAGSPVAVKEAAGGKQTVSIWRPDQGKAVDIAFPESYKPRVDSDGKLHLTFLGSEGTGNISWHDTSSGKTAFLDIDDGTAIDRYDLGKLVKDEYSDPERIENPS